MGHVMTVSESDTRNSDRKLLDELIAEEPKLPPPDIAGVTPKPMEQHLLRHRPVAVLGVVENGLVRPVDPGVTLPERSRVIIVCRDAV
jgi:hypothetical protein